MSKGLFFDMEVKPYRYGLIASIGQDRKDLKESLEATDKTFGVKRTRMLLREWDSAKEWLGFVYPMKSDSFIYLRDFPTTIETCGVMVHELLHLTLAILQSRGIDSEGKNGHEAHCYLLEHLHNEFLKKVDEHLKK